MFEMKWLKSSQNKVSPVKVMAADNFMSAIKSAKISAEVSHEKQHELFETLLQEADQIFRIFEQDQRIETLERAAQAQRGHRLLQGALLPHVL